MKIPILKIKDILLSSIQIDMTDQDALNFQRDVLQAIRRTGAQGIVIDITALEIVDSFLARVLNDTARMAKVLGTHAVLSGMPPPVALTLVEMGRGLVDVETALDLDQGLMKIQQILKSEGMGR